MAAVTKAKMIEVILDRRDLVWYKYRRFNDGSSPRRAEIYFERFLELDLLCIYLGLGAYLQGQCGGGDE